MKRERFKKPKDMQSPDMRLDSLHYNPPDLYVGAIVEFNKHTFLLTSADEYVFSYMERPTEREGVRFAHQKIIFAASYDYGSATCLVSPVQHPADPG